LFQASHDQPPAAALKDRNQDFHFGFLFSVTYIQTRPQGLFINIAKRKSGIQIEAGMNNAAPDTHDLTSSQMMQRRHLQNIIGEKRILGRSSDNGSIFRAIARQFDT
jgi:hypothetical protein